MEEMPRIQELPVLDWGLPREHRVLRKLQAVQEVRQEHPYKVEQELPAVTVVVVVVVDTTEEVVAPQLETVAEDRRMVRS